MEKLFNAAAVYPEMVSELEARLSEKIVLPDDSIYDSARRGWNLAVDQRPAMIVFAESAEDVASAVKLAHEKGLPLAVQSTGHGIIRPPHGAVLINTSRMKGLQVDPRKRTAWLEAGVKWGEVLELAQQHGLAPVLGSSPDVGAVGYTLGGGMGWLARKYGLSVDNVVRMEVVTLDGAVRTASKDENPDLFWALRGGGGGFGIVTGMEVNLHPVSVVYAGNLFYPPELAEEIFARFERWAVDAPDELTTSIVIMNYPPVPDLPEFLRGKSFIIVRGAYTGSLEEGERQMAYWRDWKKPLIDDFKPLPFLRAADISQDPLDPSPATHTGGWLTDLSPATARALIDNTLPQGGPPAVVFTEVRVAGGAISRVDPSTTAYSHREQRLLWISLSMLLSPEMESAVEAHYEQLRRALGASLTGKSYMNFLTGKEAAERAYTGYSEETLRKLQAVKAKYDPENCLSFGYNLVRK